MAGIVIIGGGVTGLSAGIHLLADGGQAHRVTVCERHTVPGGNLTGWTRGGCHIDNCVHWLTGTNPATALYREWVMSGALDGVEIRHPDSLYTCRIGGDELALWRDAARVERAMLWYSPEDTRAVRRLFRAVRAFQALAGLTDGGTDVLRPALPGLPGLALYARLTTGELAQRFRHPLLRRFLTALCDTHFSALAQIAVMAHFFAGNADLPAGGSAAMAERMASRFRSLGGVLRLGTAAESVDLAGSGGDRRACGVTVRQGTQTLHIPADYVIITADPVTVCGHILDAPMPAALARRYAAQPPQRFSAVQAAFACPSGRVGFSGELILPFPTGGNACPHASSVLLREFSHEPDFAPPGYTVVQVMAFCGEPEARRILAMSRPEYAALKRDIARTFAGIVEEVCPAVGGEGDIRLSDVWTPATYRRYVGTETGSFLGFPLLPGELLRNGAAELAEHLLSGRLDGSPAGTVPGVENVLLAGQWLRAPGGLPVAAGEGRRAARAAERFLRGMGRVHVRLAGAEKT